MRDETTKIRAATIDDAEELSRLIAEHAAFERSLASLTLSELRRQLRLSVPDTNLFVATDRHSLIGYAALTFDYALWRGKTFGHLDCLFVCADARGGGVGKQLFGHVARYAQSRGADRLEWQTPSWNHDAARFYEREGAVATSKLRFHIDWSAIGH